MKKTYMVCSPNFHEPSPISVSFYLKAYFLQLILKKKITLEMFFLFNNGDSKSKIKITVVIFSILLFYLFNLKKLSNNHDLW